MIHSFLDNLPHISPVIIAKCCIALIVLFFTRMIVKALSPMVQQSCQKHGVDQHNAYILSKIVRYIIMILGSTIALQNVGIEVSMVITAFGITGFVISYGMKDIVANFIASILIIGYKHIRIDDYIKIRDWQGTVIGINLRYTTLRHNDEIIFIPNIILYTQTVSIVRK